jgi:hypothetical protein
MPENFITGDGQVIALGVSNELAQARTSFGIDTTIDGTAFSFNFRWNTKYKYYKVTIDRGDRIVLQFFPKPYEVKIKEGFNPLSSNPDAYLFIGTTSNKQRALTPDNFGKTHDLIIATGELR